MAAQKRPSKGILKSSSSFDKGGETDFSAGKKREMKWDEMNILATYHPEDKDYGHKKIDEPPTPYSYMNEEDDDDVEMGVASKQRRRSKDRTGGGVDPSSLATKLTDNEMTSQIDEVESDSEEENLTEEQKAERQAFELKRKKHYNEFEAVRLAKKLMEEEDEDEEYDDNITAQDIVVVQEDGASSIPPESSSAAQSDTMMQTDSNS